MTESKDEWNWKPLLQRELLLPAHPGLPGEQSCPDAPPWGTQSLWPLAKKMLPPGSAKAGVPLAPHLPSAQTPVNGSSRMYRMQKHPRATAIEEGTRGQRGKEEFYTRLPRGSQKCTTQRERQSISLLQISSPCWASPGETFLSLPIGDFITGLGTWHCHGPRQVDELVRGGP